MIVAEYIVQISNPFKIMYVLPPFRVLLIYKNKNNV